MECPKCHEDADKFYLKQAVASEHPYVCLRCLATFLWDSNAANADKQTDTLYNIEGEAVEKFLKSLTELLTIDDNRKLYRQVNSNNLIVVQQSAANPQHLKCLDITLDVNEA